MRGFVRCEGDLKKTCFDLLSPTGSGFRVTGAEWEWGFNTTTMIGVFVVLPFENRGTPL